jgi:hypothetical protein
MAGEFSGNGCMSRSTASSSANGCAGAAASIGTTFDGGASEEARTVSPT